MSEDLRRELRALNAYRETVAEDLADLVGGVERLDELVPGWNLCLGGRAFAEFVGALQDSAPVSEG